MRNIQSHVQEKKNLADSVNICLGTRNKCRPQKRRLKLPTLVVLQEPRDQSKQNCLKTVKPKLAATIQHGGWNNSTEVKSQNLCTHPGAFWCRPAFSPPTTFLLPNRERQNLPGAQMHPSPVQPESLFFLFTSQNRITELGARNCKPKYRHQWNATVRIWKDFLSRLFAKGNTKCEWFSYRQLKNLTLLNFESKESKIRSHSFLICEMEQTMIGVWMEYEQGRQEAQDIQILLKTCPQLASAGF